MQHEISRNSGASSSLSTISPSFNSYSSENIADIAARVIHELNISNEQVYDDDVVDFYSSIPQNDAVSPDVNDNEDEDDDDNESEFEFAVLCGEDTSSPISADEIFSNGQIKPIYPIFGHQNDAVLETESSSSKTTRLPLRTLMSNDRELRNDSVSSSSTTSSSSDGGAAELEGVPPETYCVWAPPKGGEEAVTMKKKSNSTGTTTSSTSKRWRFKDLLHRSSSDGKETFVFLTPAQNKITTGVEKVTAVKNNGKKIEEVKMKSNNTPKKKNKSYLQYTPDVVGFFGNVNGINRTIRPF